uniref:Uncharacterized protein n=1 Tax=Rhizophora mucronata TaxID=61149 RepID=A0A2P2QE23_RHIMU
MYHFVEYLHSLFRHSSMCIFFPSMVRVQYQEMAFVNELMAIFSTPRNYFSLRSCLNVN